MNKVQEFMKEEILSSLANGEGFDSIKDRSGEFVDSYLPVYNNEIIAEWQNMPGEYDDTGVGEFDYSGQTLSIIRLMSLDLYVYYSDLFYDVIQNIESEITLCEDCNCAVTVRLEPYGDSKMAVTSCPNCGESYDTNLDPADIARLEGTN